MSVITQKLHGLVNYCGNFVKNDVPVLWNSGANSKQRMFTAVGVIAYGFMFPKVAIIALGAQNPILGIVSALAMGIIGHDYLEAAHNIEYNISPSRRMLGSAKRKNYEGTWVLQHIATVWAKIGF